MITKTYTGTLQVINCYRCYMAFGIPREFYDDLLELRERGAVFCPSCGSRQNFIGESDEARLKRRLAETQEEVNRQRNRRCEAEYETRTVKRQRNALKGHLARTKKRAAAGTCPCCKRTFQALSRHMLKQHPGYVEANKTKEKK